VLFSAFGYQTILGSEHRATVLCKQTASKEITDRDRLPKQQPVHLQKKEETNHEANYFYLKSCPANWVHLRVLQKIYPMRMSARDMTLLQGWYILEKGFTIQALEDGSLLIP
jgi:hypothetical protein